MTESLYVYGVMSAGQARAWPGTTGIDGPVRVVVSEDLAALVSPLAPGHVPGRREDIEAHRHVLELANEVATTVPMRFGMVIDGEAVVRERLLGEHAERLSTLLRDLAGQVQMTVRAYYADGALLETVAASDPELARRAVAIAERPEDQTRDERIALGERIARAADERRTGDGDALLSHLMPFASDVRVDPPGSERVALSAHLLVPREQRPGLDATVRALSRELDGVLAISYIGPLPPYAFADVELEGGAR